MIYGFYMGRIYAANPPSTAAATTSAAAEEAKSLYLQSPTYLTYVIIIYASVFLTSKTMRTIPQLHRVFIMFDKE